MSVIKKPDLKIFAQDAKTGEIESFPDILRGWGITLERTAGKPPLEWFNAIGKRVDEWLMYLTQRGVAEWDASLSYPKTAIVQFNSIVYVSVKETKGEQPDKSQASWSTLGLFLGLDKYSTTAAMNLELNKKMDKANISGVKGNDNDKVPSLNLFTTELGKKQPAGDYQPKGDYATNDDLNNELNKKRDISDFGFKGTVNIIDPSKNDFLSFGNDLDEYKLKVSIANNNTNGQFYFHDRVSKRTIILPIHEKSGTIALTNDIPNIVNATGASITDVMNQNSVTNELNKKFDKTGGVINATSKAIDIATRANSSGYIQISDENGKAIHQIGKISADSALSVRNESENSTLTVKGDGVRFNENKLALKSEIPSYATKFQDVTSSRSNNVNYVNTNNHLIFVVLQSKSSTNQNASFAVNGVVVRWVFSGSAEGNLTSATIPVPAGATYSANGFEKWFEVS